jgi:hypothetical protein
MIRYQSVYRVMRDSFPLRLRGNLPQPSLQTDYVKALMSECICFLCLSLSLFFFRQTVLGGLCLAGFFLNIYWTMKAWGALP